MRKLFGEIAARNIGFGVYKNTAQIPQAMQALADFDLLIDPSDYGPFVELLEEFSAIRALPHPLYDNAMEGREDWFVPLQHANYLHLDVAKAIFVGKRFRKRFPALLYSDVGQWEERKFGGISFQVVSARDQAKIAFLRAIFRSPSLLMGRSIAMGKELAEPFSRITTADGNSLCLEYLVGKDRFQIAVRRDGNTLHYDRAQTKRLRSRILRSAGADLSVQAADQTIHSLRRFGFALASRLTAQSSAADAYKRRLAPQGVIVTLMGVDGSGKSTQTAKLAEVLGRKFRVRILYLGSNDGGWMRVRHRFRRSGAKSVSESNSTGRSSVKSRLKLWGRSAWRMTIAIRRWLNVHYAQFLRNRGVIVICDRWPQSLEAGYLDGPSKLPARPSWFVRLTHAFELDLHRRMAAIQPDLTIHLLIDFATSHARKPGDIDEGDFERRNALMTRMRTANLNIVLIDARSEPHSVATAIFTAVWKAIFDAR
ncbi:hypothetical protein [Altererythrobacter sp. MF3-039]|uniref:hypothetical protein n=1 Tax=Altererythrobacter sp. MF3-039 TaxID=3252901 RepID=UPI00390C8DA7